MLRHWLLIKKLQTCLNESDKRSQRQLITGYSTSVVSCEDISIEWFLYSCCSVFVIFSSLNMWLDVLHLEYHFIACFIRLTNCLKMSVTSTSMTSFWCLYCWIWTCLTLSSVVDFEQLNVCLEFFYFSYLL